MKFEQVILAEREYHRKVSKNESQSYWKKGKTKYDYSDKFDPGRKRLITQIQDKARNKYDAYLSRSQIEKFLDSESSQKIFDRMEKIANAKFSKGSDKYKAYLYGGFCTTASRILSNGKQESGIKYLL